MDATSSLAALQDKGYFVLPLSDEVLDCQKEMFRQFDLFDSRPISEKEVFSLTPDAIGENNGWHGAGGLSRYNQCREGVIFQASCPIWPMLSGNTSSSPNEFSIALENFRCQAHGIARNVMEQIAIGLNLCDPGSYFTTKGPLDVIGGSQFHVKKVMLNQNEDLSALHKDSDGERYLTLRAHRDPSVISIVFHKWRSAGASFGSGLQFKDPNEGFFSDVPIRSEGPDQGSCIVIAGSILEVLSGGRIKAPLHRVMSFESELRAADRVAATFFFQPHLDCVLTPFPSPMTFRDEICSGESDDSAFSLARNSVKEGGGKEHDKKTKKKIATTPMTYGIWKAKAYGSYYKGK